MSRRGPACIVLASGGMDSAALLVWAARRYGRVVPLYVRAGYRWEDAEQHALRRLVGSMRKLRQFATVDAVQTTELRALPRLQPDWSVEPVPAPGVRSRDAAVFLPARNLLLLTAAAPIAHAEAARDILIGTLASNPFPDGRAAFFRAMSRALSIGLGRQVRVCAPFRTHPKRSVASLLHGLPLGAPLSCLAPRRRGRTFAGCGRCNKCSELASAIN